MKANRPSQNEVMCFYFIVATCFIKYLIIAFMGVADDDDDDVDTKLKPSDYFLNKKVNETQSDVTNM